MNWLLAGRKRRKLGILELVKIERNGSETILEITPVSDGFVPSNVWYFPGHIEETERYYKKTGKPKKSYIDVIYITRRQIEREKT